MRFVFPQFIEYESKTIGPFTFRQFVFIGIAGFICFILWFILKPISILLFLLAALIIMSIAFAFAFFKVSGKSLLSFLGSVLNFNITPKIYIWKKKETPVMVLREIKKQEEEESEEELPLKIAGKSQLRKLSTDIETKTK